MNKTTINDAIKILQDAANQMGGDCHFICFDSRGDVVRPLNWDVRIGIKGNEEFEEVYLK